MVNKSSDTPAEETKDTTKGNLAKSIFQLAKKKALPLSFVMKKETVEEKKKNQIQSLDSVNDKK